MSKELEALENIKQDLEYITRLDYVEPIVRGEVRDNLYKIYHRELPELDIIEKALKNYDKLSQSQDTKKESGVDPVMLFKALKDDIWVKNESGSIVKQKINYIEERCLTYVGYSLGGWDDDYPDIEKRFYYKDYGTLWALTREELEKPKEN